MTYAAPIRLTSLPHPDRASAELVALQHRSVTANPLVGALLDSFPEPAAIVNATRQVVAANDKMAAAIGAAREALIGLRIGEAFGCEHSAEAPHGCGTTPACSLCGALHATLMTQATREPAHEECRLTLAPRPGREALEFRVFTTPVEVAGEPFTVFAVKDVSDEKRRRVLERMFFHDVLNSAGGLRNLLEAIPSMGAEKTPELLDCASHVASQLVEEIQAHRDLTAAERGELEPQLTYVDAPLLIQDVVALYETHSAGEGRSLAVDIAGTRTRLRTDPLLLRRVLGNLVKNALEASSRGEVVTVRYRDDPAPHFEVHNPRVMPEAVKLQMFQRSFSTKPGPGRGVGTYSARLLTEHYLHGELRFRSEEAEGTTFTVMLPEGQTDGVATRTDR